MAQRIIDRDIAFYQSEVERLQAELRRCLPSHEPKWHARIAAAELVVVYLQNYRIKLDVAPAGATEELDVVDRRQTFEVPAGYKAVRDEEGRATGQIVPEALTEAQLEARVKQLASLPPLTREAVLKEAWMRVPPPAPRFGVHEGIAKEKAEKFLARSGSSQRGFVTPEGMLKITSLVSDQLAGGKPVAAYAIMSLFEDGQAQSHKMQALDKVVRKLRKKLDSIFQK